MAKTIHSGNLTFIDLTDSKKVDVHIASNLPTTQIFDGNIPKYSPDWTNTPLELTLTAYADSTNITTMLTNDDDITWYRQIGSGDYIKVQDGDTKLTIRDNELGISHLGLSAGVISYICSIKYNNKTFESKLTFARVDTGIKGAAGSAAPAVQAQYSVDGLTNWTSVLNTAIHKYVKYSYDGGTNWTTAIKMVGEDGTSVRIKGTATSKEAVSGTSYWTLIYNSAIITGATLGDAYLLDGHLYVCVDSRDGNDHFMDVGQIQGPKGNDGVSEYVYIRYASKVNPSDSDMTPTPSNTTTHIGICVSTATSAPLTASSYTWSKFVGENAKSLVLSADAQVFKVSNTTPVVYTPTTIKVTAHRINIASTETLTWYYNGSTTRPDGVMISGDTVTIIGNQLTTNSLVIKVAYDNLEDVFTVYKAFDGSKGDAAPISFLTNENITFGANAQGSITTVTTFTTEVVAYIGTQPVIPELRTKADGTIDFPDLPTGITATHMVSGQKVAILFTITDRTLGSTSSNNGTITIPVLTPARADLQLTWSKVNAGTKGDKGDNGTDAYTVMLTNEAYTFAGDINHAYADTVTTQIFGYKGATQQSITIQSVGGTVVFEDDIDYTIIGITGLTFKCSGPEITFTCTESFTSASGVIPIVILVDGQSFTRMFSYAIAFKGATGETGSKGDTGAPATSYWLISSASAVQKTSTGTITVTPSTLTFTGKSNTGTNAPVDYACRWVIDYSTNGTDYTTLYTSTTNEISKSITVATTYKTIRARMYMAGGTTALLDEQIIPVVSDGEKGASGKGVSSIVEQYYQSTSATTQSDGSWSITVPTWADGKYIWTRSVITYTDNTTTTTSPVCVTGQKGSIGGTGIGISSIDVWYYQSSLATSLSGGSWSTTSPTWVDGKYIWTKTITTYTNNATDETAAVCITGQKGSTGVGVKSVTEYYLATASSSGVTTSTTGWTTTIQTITVDKKYLWNYEVITYTDNTTSTTSPIIIGVFGNTGATGKGIQSVTEYYLATTSASGVTTATTGWSTTMQTLTATNKYLWNYELITYTDNTTATINPVIIGVYGDKGSQGDKGDAAYTVILTNESHVFAGDIANAITASATTQVLAYQGSTSQSVTIVSVNGKTASTSSTATGIAGLSFTCSALSGTSPTITFTCTTSFVSPNGAIPIVITVGGVTITKMFTYSIAFKGSLGSPGTPASLVDITPSAYYFKSTTGKDGTFTPDYIYLYPRFQTVTFSKWEYSTNGGTTWVAASGANGLTISEYNSVKNTLRIARTSTLYTDTITSISFRCVSSTSTVYDTVSIAKIYDIVDLQIGGRNYILNSAPEITKETGVAQAEYLSLPYDLTPYIEEHGVDQTYTLSFDLKSKDITNNNRISVYPEPGTTPPHKYAFPNTSFVVTQEYQRFSITFKPTRSSNANATLTRISVYGTYDTGNIPVIKNLKLELGNKATDWSPAPEDLKSTTFQLYAPKGYLITNDVPTITLETFAYDGSQPITGATFAWYRWNGEAWVAISGITSASLTLNKSNVLKSSVYKCAMTYSGKVYEATATVEDKTDVYDSLIHITSKYSSTNRLYWILYSTVYSEEGERDELLGPIGTTAPSSPATGSYWYKVDETNYTVTLMKYSGTAWATTTDKQQLVYDWFLLNDADKMITLGAQSKVKIVTANDFSRTCSVQCNVSDAELIPLTHNNQILTDPSDPIISATAPIDPINGQLWIKTNANGSYVLSVWDSASEKWVVSEADTQNKVYVTKPTQYNTGDLWIVDSNYQPVAYENGVAQTYRHLEKTMLRATATSQTYSDSHWVEALKYQKELDNVIEDVEKFKQFMSIDDTGLIMQAKGANGTVSDFKTVLTNTELGFYQGASRVAYINNNQLNISKAEITNGMVIGGTTPELAIGNFVLIQESNGSLSIGLKS